MVAVNRVKNRGGLKPDKYLDIEDVARMMSDVCRRAKNCKAGSKRALVNEMIMKLLLATGLRAAELCDLKIRDLPCYHGKNVIWIDCGKGAVSRTVEIEQAVADEIAQFVKQCRKGAKPGSYLFVNERGGKLSYRSLYSKVTLIGERARIRKLHPHMLRHTFLTLLYDVARDIRLVQEVAGHRSPNTTAIYARTLNSARRRQIEQLNISRFFA